VTADRSKDYMRILVTFLVLLMLAVGWKIYDNREKRLAKIEQLEKECGQSFIASNTKLIGLHGKWLDAEQVAKSTARIALPSQLARLQGIRQEVESVDVPSCASNAKHALSSYMRDTERMFLSFMSKKDNEMLENMSAATDKLDEYTRSLTTATKRHSEVKDELARLRR
jgi:hypothetical protein